MVEHIAAIYGRVRLDDVPQWLVDLQRKYNQHHEHHVTFVQRRLINKDKPSALQTWRVLQAHRTRSTVDTMHQTDINTALPSESGSSMGTHVIAPEHEVPEMYFSDLDLSWEQLEGKRVLDLGAGLAEFAQAAKEHGIEIVSLERSPELWKHAGEPPTNVEYHVGDAIDLPFDDASFDMVISRSGPLSNERNQDRFLVIIAQAMRVLKPGGELRFGPTPISHDIVHAEGEVIDRSTVEGMTAEERAIYLVDRTDAYLQKAVPGIERRTLTTTSHSDRQPPYTMYYVLQRKRT